MSAWLDETRDLQRAERSTDPARIDRQLRQFDLLVALLVAPFAAFGVLLALALGARLRHCTCLGVRWRPFNLVSLALPPGLRGAALRLLGATEWPVAFNVLRGDMAWAGPRPTSADGAATAPARDGSATAVRPGVISLWSVRQRCAVDYGTEADADREYLACRGLRHDVGLLLRAMLAAILGQRRMQGSTARVTIVDVACDSLTLAQAIDRICALLGSETTRTVFFANPACINIAARDARYRRALARAHMVLPDGIGMKIGADLLGTPIRQNVNGTDLFPRLCERLAERGARVFLLGGAPGVPQRVGQIIGERWPGIVVAGERDGFFGPDEEPSVVAQIAASGADVLLVARGVPLQECFIDRHARQLGVSVALGVGGLFDFVSGRIPRAPRWMRDVGLEWIYRLWQEPGRMWRRYLIGNFTFLARVVLQRLGLRAPRTASPSPAQPAACLAPPSPVAAHAVVFATQPASATLPVPEAYPACLLPLGHASFAERVLESLAAAGVKSADVVISDRPEELRRLLGDGQRWGLALRLHVVKDAARPYGILRSLMLAHVGRVIIGHAHRWIPATSLRCLTDDDRLALHLQGGAQVRWSGWASLPPSRIEKLDVAARAVEMERLIGALREPTLLLDPEHPLCPDEPTNLLEAQRIVLQRMAVSSLPQSWRRSDAIAVSPGAYVDPRARLIGPVAIGPGCHIGGDATVGPNAVLARDVVVAAGATVADALVLQDTLINAALDVSNAIACGNRIHHLHLGVGVAVSTTDRLLLGLKPATNARPTVVGRIAAAIAAALLSPVAAIDSAARAMQRLPPRWRSELVVVGRDPDSSGLKTTRLRLPRRERQSAVGALAHYGGLLDIAAGRRCWFGVRPRRPSEWHALSREWQMLIGQAPIGLVHMRGWTDREDLLIEASAAADAFYAVRRGWVEHIRMGAALAAGLLRSRPRGVG